MPDAASIILTLHLDGAAEASVRAACGETLLAALRRAEIGIRHVCGGRCACGTCRIAVDADWIGRLSEPSRDETRLLAVLPGALPAHRLACQITLDERMARLAFRLDTPATRTHSAKAMETHP